MEYQKKNRSMPIQFNSQALENLSEPFEVDEMIDDRLEALRGCLKKLPETHKRIIRMRYSDNLAIKEIALKMGRPIHGMYKAMIKIQFSLQECIEGVLKKWNVI
jgi:RNA polymerase sigma-70 factor (ECF subfamily)